MSPHWLQVPFLLIVLLPKYAFADVAGDVGVIGAMITVQDALPAESLAILGVWAVLQYTESWDVDDGPLSGVLAWWRWKFWSPPPAIGAELSLLDSSSSTGPAHNTQSYTNMPSISYSNVITCWIFLVLFVTPLNLGIFWPNYGSYAVALFGLFIVAWRSLTKLVHAVPIPTGPETGYNDTLASPEIHDAKSRALNALAGLHEDSVYGVMASDELRHVECTYVSDFLKGRRLCTTCHPMAEEWGRGSWSQILDLLQQHSSSGDSGEECDGRASFRWTRRGTSSEEPLRIQDPNISVAIIYGGLGAWRIKPAPFAHRLLKTIILLAILFPLCFGFQVIFALLALVIPVYRYYSQTPTGADFYVPMNNVVPSGLYAGNRKFVSPLPTPASTDYSSNVPMILGLIFALTGAVGFIIGCLEARAATHLIRFLSPPTLRKISCWMMASYGAFVGALLSLAAGYHNSSSWQTGLEYTLALLVSGLFLGASFVWRAHHGKIGDTKSWPIPPTAQTDEADDQPPQINNRPGRFNRWLHRWKKEPSQSPA